MKINKKSISLFIILSLTFITFATVFSYRISHFVIKKPDNGQVVKIHEKPSENSEVIAVIDSEGVQNRSFFNKLLDPFYPNRAKYLEAYPPLGERFIVGQWSPEAIAMSNSASNNCTGDHVIFDCELIVQNPWIKIRYKRLEGWVQGKYLSVRGYWQEHE